MNKQKVNYFIDFLALVSFIATALSGLAIRFFMPSGVRQGRLQEFLGIQKGVWSEIHDWSGILLIIFCDNPLRSSLGVDYWYDKKCLSI